MVCKHEEAVSSCSQFGYPKWNAMTPRTASCDSSSHHLQGCWHLSERCWSLDSACCLIPDSLSVLWPWQLHYSLDSVNRSSVFRSFEHMTQCSYKDAALAKSCTLYVKPSGLSFDCLDFVLHCSAISLEEYQYIYLLSNQGLMAGGQVCWWVFPIQPLCVALDCEMQS